MIPITVMAIVALTLINYYLAKRLRKGLKIILPIIGFRIYFAVFSLASVLLALGFVRSMLPLPAQVKGFLGTASAYSMAILVYLLIYVSLMDLILFTVRILTGKKLPLRTLCTVAVIALTA